MLREGRALALRGLSKAEIGDFIATRTGRAAGFLQAGVPGVLCTLWPVEDLSTALLMIKFYELHLFRVRLTDKGPLSPAEALAGAQRWARELTNRDLREYFADQQAETAEPSASLSGAPRIRFTNKFVAEKLQELEKAAPDQCPYANPYFWAPFVLVGT